MDFAWSSEMEMMRDELRAFAKRFPASYWREKDRTGTFPSEYWHALGDAGWLTALVPEEYGGSGLGPVEMVLITEELVGGGVGGTGGILLIANLVFGTMSILHHGSDEQKAKFMPMMGDGKSVFAMALTEPDAGSNTLEITSYARKDGDGWLLNGRKVWSSNFERAPVALVLCRTTPQDKVNKKTDGLSTFLIENPAQRKGIDIRPIDKHGMGALVSNEVFFDDVRLDKSELLGEEGKGWKQILNVLNPERMVGAAISVGLGRLAIEAAVRYANERRVFGRPIGANQSISFPLAECSAQLEAASLLNYKAAWLFSKGMPCVAEVNMAKYLATEACWKACDWAVQVHGGFGYAKEYDVERYMREARLHRIAPVSSQMALNFISEHVLGLPRSY